ncbi:head-tail connector protein [Georgenia sp.]
MSAADAKLPRLIGAASESIRRYINRPQLHYAAAFVERLPGYLQQVRLRLGLLPILSVASVVLPDGTSLAANEYVREDDDAGVLYRSVGWPWTGLVRAGALYDSPAVGTEAKTIVVTYAGGWVTPAMAGTRTLPFDLEEACLQAVSAMYRRQGIDQLVASESLGDYSVSFREVPPLEGLVPASVLAQLSGYRRLLG